MNFQDFIYDSFKKPDNPAPADQVKPPQIIRLTKALPRLENEKLNLKIALNQFLKELAGIELDRRAIMTRDWSDVDRKSDELGLEKINWFINGLIQLKKQPAHFELLDIDLLNLNLKKWLAELGETITALETFGYFESGSSTENMNLIENRKVLIVEDMPYNRVLLTKILKRHNCQVTEAVNGKDAVEQWEQDPSFELVIMDMNMPVMDGFEATRTIRQLEKKKNRKHIPVIALTALAMRGDREKCIEAGCDEYMTKPVETNVLLSTCNTVLSGTENENALNTAKSIDIQNVILKTENQIYDTILTSVLQSIGIEIDRVNNREEIIQCLLEDRTEFLILEAETDLSLAYYIRNSFPDKRVILITTPKHSNSILCQKTKSNIRYPFSREKIISVLQHSSNMHHLAKVRAESIADADSLGKIKGQASIKEAVEKSNHQLAVWQKAFRKIGGDLVLSHQFNLHGKYGFILGDVSGHDIQSGYTASWFAGLVKGVWGQYSAPFDLLRYLNSFLDQNEEEGDKRFVCALVLLWDPLRHKLSFANAGIPGGILVKKETGKATLIKWTGIPIGMFPEMEMFDHDEIDFEPGDRLYIATDGVLEAIPSEIISGIGETKSDEPPQQALESIVDFVTRSIEVTDDLTIAVFEGHHFKEPQNGFRRTIQSNHPALESVIKQIETFLNSTAQDRFDTTRVLMAVREGLINALEHGNNNIPDLPIDIDLELFENRMEIHISDSGGGFDLLGEKQKLEKEGDLRIRGRGIELMEEICSSITYNGSGVCMEFKEISPETAPSGD